MTRTAAARLLAIWQGPFEQAVANVAWLGEMAFVVKDGAGTFGDLRGPRTLPSPLLVGDTSALKDACNSPESVLLLRGTQALSLWPLALYGEPRTANPGSSGPGEAPQIYVRRGEVQLQYTPLGSDHFCQTEGEESALEEFRKLFRLDQFQVEAEQRARFVRGFEKDLHKDAAQLVARREEVETLVRLLRETRPGLIWLGGQAGAGKSFVVAGVVVDWLKVPQEGVLFLPYRFKFGDDRCSRESFLLFALERIEEWVGKTRLDGGKMRPFERLKSLLSRLDPGRRVIFVLDGLDEISERDPRFALETPLALQFPQVTWLCAGRAERGLPELFRDARAIEPWPAGLPRMSEGDIREMILEKIGPLRRKLLQGDRDEGDRVTNAFISRVAKCAEGLPIYVKYVIGDVLQGKISPEATTALPPSLDAYHEEVLRRCSVGDIQAVLTPLAATLAIAKEPLTIEELTALLQRRDIVERVRTVSQALSSIASMLRRAPDRDGGEGYTLHHLSLLHHMLKSPVMTEPIAMARKTTAKAVLTPKEDAVSQYLYCHGLTHLLDFGSVEDALELLSNPSYLKKRFQILSNQQKYDLLGPVRNALVSLPSPATNPVVEATFAQICRTTQQQPKEMMMRDMLVDVLTARGPEQVQGILLRIMPAGQKVSWWRKWSSVQDWVLGKPADMAAEFSDKDSSDAARIAMEVASNLSLPSILLPALLQMNLHQDLTLRAAAVQYTYLLWQRDPIEGFLLLRQLARSAAPGLTALPNRFAFESCLMLSSLVLFEPRQNPLVLAELGGIWKGLIVRVLRLVLVGRRVLPKLLDFIFVVLKHHPQLGALHDGKMLDQKGELQKFFRRGSDCKGLYRRLVGYMDVDTDFPQGELERDYLAAIETDDSFILIAFLFSLVPRACHDPAGCLPLLRTLFHVATTRRSAHPYLTDITAAVENILNTSLAENRTISDEVFDFFVEAAEACQEVYQREPQTIRDSLREAPTVFYLGPYAVYWFEKHGTQKNATLLNRRVEDALTVAQTGQNCHFFRILVSMELPCIAISWNRPQVALEVIDLFIEPLLNLSRRDQASREVLDLLVNFLARLRTVYREPFHPTFLGPRDVDHFLARNGVPDEISLRVKIVKPIESIGDLLDHRCWHFIRDQVILNSPKLRKKLMATLDHAAECKNLGGWFDDIARQVVEQIYAR